MAFKAAALIKLGIAKSGLQGRCPDKIGNCRVGFKDAALTTLEIAKSGMTKLLGNKIYPWIDGDCYLGSI